MNAFVLALASYLPAATLTGLVVRLAGGETDDDADGPAPRWAWVLLASLWVLCFPLGMHLLNV
jgi:hypothetical protein